jgi:hypothetical protein
VIPAVNWSLEVANGRLGSIPIVESDDISIPLVRTPSVEELQWV